jgi:hypothetical protein
MTTFYECVITPVSNVMKHVYGEKGNTKGFTLKDRLGDGKCLACNGDEWLILPKETNAVKEGGKPYIECIKCGVLTHL